MKKQMKRKIKVSNSNKVWFFEKDVGWKTFTDNLFRATAFVETNVNNRRTNSEFSAFCQAWLRLVSFFFWLVLFFWCNEALSMPSFLFASCSSSKFFFFRSTQVCLLFSKKSNNLIIILVLPKNSVICTDQIWVRTPHWGGPFEKTLVSKKIKYSYFFQTIQGLWYLLSRILNALFTGGARGM